LPETPPFEIRSQGKEPVAWKMLREIIGTVENTYMESEEYLLLKAEILFDANDWKEATLVYNLLEKKKGKLPNELNERIQILHEKIKDRENMNRKNRLISYSNQISKNLFEKDEEIKRAKQ
jgi:hypothetical protein